MELNIAPSLASVGDLAQALQQGLATAAASLTEDLQAAIGAVDSSAIEATLSGGIAEAIAGANATVVVEADVSAVTADVGDAIAAADTTVPLEPDGSQIPLVIEEGIKESDTTVPLQPTLDPSEITALGQAASQSVFESQVSNVAGGVGNAQGVIAEGAAAVGTAESVNALEKANRGLETANAGLEGSVGGVTSAFGPMGVALAGVTGLGAAFFSEAVNEETAARRLEFVFGDLAKSIQQVSLPANNFNLSLQQIATTTGASLPGLEQVNSKIGSIGTSAGATAPQIAQTANQITALATYLAVTNPALGSADTIMNSLTGSLARGGRSAASLGLSLSATEIAAKAHSIAIADGRDTVTQFDKIAAGAAITTANLGQSLGTAVAQGSNQAALALPRLTETLKETVAAVGAPLIGPITQLFTNLAPPLEGLATTIGHLLQAASPLIGVLGLVLNALSALIGVVNAIPMPVLTLAVEAFTAALVVEKIATFAAGLLTLGANATADVGAVGLLTASVDGLLLALGPVGIAIAAVGALWAITNASQSIAAGSANQMALATAGLKSNTDIAKESQAQLQTQLDTVNAKITELKGQGQWYNPATLPAFLDMQLGVGKTAAEIKALSAEAASLTKSLDATKSSTDGLSNSQASGASAAAAFGAAIQASAAKLDGVKVAIASVESANNSLVTAATGKLTGVSTVFGDVSTAIDAAAKASASQATSSNSGAAALATQATHAKDLRDAMSALNTAQADFNTLAAGPSADKVAAGLLSIDAAAKTVRDDVQKVADAQTTLNTLAAGPDAELLAAGYLSIEQAARSTRTAQQAVVDAQTALNALRAGPTPTTSAQAAEDVAKAQTNQQKATLALSDAQFAQANAIAAGTATARQLEDAQIKVTEAQFGLTDATRALGVAQVAQAKLTSDALPGSVAMKDAQNKLADAQLALQVAQQAQEAAQDKQNQLIADSVPGSKALTTAQNNLADAQLSLAQAQQTQETAQDAQNKLFADSLPGSAAYVAALQKVSDAQDHLTSVIESGSAKQASATKAAAKTHVDALASLQTGLDEQIASENKFFTDLEKIQAEGGTEIVAELLAQGPKTGAAEASAVAGATVTVVAALETKAETLKTAEDKHAQEIATIFGASLNANLLKAFSTQLTNETNFYANVQKIFEAGNTVLANALLAQGPIQGAALAGAVANATPVVQHALEVQAEELKTAEAKAGTDVGKSFGDGLFAGINGANARVFAAAQALGTSAQAGTAAAIKPGSPSRVAMELGSQWAEGLALGITGGVPLVASAASQLAGALVVSPNAPALSTGSTVAASGQAASGPGVINQHVVVNEVAQDPAATAFAVASRLGTQAMR